jgi:hypothetical protein
MNKFVMVLTAISCCGLILTGCESTTNCTPHAGTYCEEGVNYWVDSCGEYEDVINQCTSGCKADHSGCEGDAQSCELPTDCPAGEGCRADVGLCGTCRDVNDCRSGETCNTNGLCLTPCAPGPCCEEGSYVMPNFECASWDEFRCSGTQCGADAQQRTVRQRCSGVSSSCDGAVTEGSWGTLSNCGPNSVCWSSDTEAGCTDCPVVCMDGACGTCSDEPCCADGAIAAQGIECDNWVEYQCTSTDCGGDAQERTVTQVCSGDSVMCSGAISEGNWATQDDCDNDSICWSDTEGSGCTQCTDSCENGACTEPCDPGVCCDNGSLRDTDFTCATVVEYRCTDVGCGDDLEERSITQNCSGTSSECTGAVVEGEWGLSQDCGDDDLCWSDEVAGGCNTCELGCASGICNPCTDEPCCDNGEHRPSGFQCGSWTEYRCTGDQCGDDAQQRQVRQYCSGDAALCTGATVEDSWTTIDVCHDNDVCQTDDNNYAECFLCVNGCDAGQCLN